MLICCTLNAVSHAVAVTGGSANAARAMTLPMVGSSSSSSSLSSSDDRWEFYELVHAADDSRRLYSDATC